MSERTFSDPVMIDSFESERIFSDPVVVEHMDSEYNPVEYVRTFCNSSSTCSKVTSLMSECKFNVELKEPVKYENIFNDSKRNYSEILQVTSLVNECKLDTEPIKFERTFSNPIVTKITKNCTDNCELIKLMQGQILGDDYNTSSEILWIYERIDTISEKLNICIDEPLQRNILLSYLKEMYNPFNEYLHNNHKEAFERHRNGRYSFVLEYHALHEYLKINGFTKDNVINYIFIDKNNRNIFQDFRDQGNCRYFNKTGQNELKHSDYTSLKNKKYSYNYKYE